MNNTPRPVSITTQRTHGRTRVTLARVETVWPGNGPVDRATARQLARTYAAPLAKGTTATVHGEGFALTFTPSDLAR